MKIKWLCGLVLALVACGEETLSGESDQILREEKKEEVTLGGSVRASEVLSNLEKYEIKVNNGYYSKSFPEISCEEKEPDWLQAISNMDYSKRSEFELSINLEGLEVKIIEEGQEETLFLVPRNELQLFMFGIERESGKEFELFVSSNECPFANSYGLQLFAEVFDNEGKQYTPDLEFVDSSSEQEFYSFSNDTRIDELGECDEGFGQFLYMIKDDYLGRARISEGKLLLEGAGSFLSEERDSYAIPLDDPNLQFVNYEKEGYWIRYKTNYCDMELQATFRIYPVTKEYWEDEL